jgi:RNA polymerase subunit RPABC4/transcription elongation factor Spt4
MSQKAKSRICKKCGATISASAKQCKVCGAYTSFSTQVVNWLFIVGVIIVIFLIYQNIEAIKAFLF